MRDDQEMLERLRGELRKLDVDLACATRDELDFGLAHLDLTVPVIDGVAARRDALGRSAELRETLAKFTELKSRRNALVNRRNQVLSESAALKMKLNPEVQYHGGIRSN